MEQQNRAVGYTLACDLFSTYPSGLSDWPFSSWLRKALSLGSCEMQNHAAVLSDQVSGEEERTLKKDKSRHSVIGGGIAVEACCNWRVEMKEGGGGGGGREGGGRQREEAWDKNCRWPL